ncbi:MAG: ribosome biogenesis GTPase Der [Planctomycetes bacterium]|nr:ribosome biogenesis GTPase Der [Planctomycetota bacterium]
MIPKVVIVGRPNVGKSSLLNLLAGRLISIVDPTAGVTRDRVATTVELPPETRGDPIRVIEVIDTGGYGIEDTQNLTEDVEQQIAYAIAQADAILFVIDAQSGIVSLDRRTATMLRTSTGKRKKVPVILVANKVDGSSHESGAYEAAELGFGDPVLISATTGHNKIELMDRIRAAIDWDRLPPSAEPEPTGMLLAIVGKRNAGKSSLVNSLAGEPRVIVNELEGTTRDSVDVRFEMDGKLFTAIDTAGVRKTKSLDGDIEYYSHHRALRSVRRADVVIFMLDATVPVSQVDHQLAMEVQRHFKPVVLVVNKWDLAEQKTTQEEYIEYLDKQMRGLDFAPVAFISASKGEGVIELIQTALTLYDQAGQRVTTGELNRVMEAILAEKAPVSGIGRRPKIYYTTQLGVFPPTVGLFVNDPSMFDNGYQRFLINRFREELPYPEVPIKLIIRGREKTPGKDDDKSTRRPSRAEKKPRRRPKGK